MEKLCFRYATEKDTALVLQFIRELAEYEQMLDEVVATEEILQEWIFEKKKAEVIFVLESDAEVGFALFFHNFSTFLGRSGVYLEDLYVKPEYRGKGLGNAFFAFLRDAYPHASRFRLEIEPDNERAERLYKKMGFG